MVTDFALAVTLTFNGSQASTGAQQAAQAFTDLAAKMQAMGQSAGGLGQSFGTINTSAGQVSQSMGSVGGALSTVNQSSNQVKTSIDGTKTSFDNTKTSLEGTNTSLASTNSALSETNTEFQNTSTTLESAQTALQGTNTELDLTNTGLQNVTTSVQTQDPELQGLVQTMDQYVTAGTDAVTSLQNQTTAMEQLNPVVNDVTGTLGQTNTVTKDLTPSLDAMVNSVKSSGPPLANLDAELVEHNTQTTAATTNSGNWSTSLVTTGLSIATMFTSVVNLAKGIRDYNDGAIRVESAEKRELTTRESLDKATRILADALKKYGAGSSQVEKATLDVTEATKGHNVAVLKLKEASEAFADSQLGIVTNSFTSVLGLLGTVAGGWGNYQKILKETVTVLGGVATANEIAGGSFLTVGKGADAAKVSVEGLKASLIVISGILAAVTTAALLLPKALEAGTKAGEIIPKDKQALSPIDALLQGKLFDKEENKKFAARGEIGGAIFQQDLLPKTTIFGDIQKSMAQLITSSPILSGLFGKLGFDMKTMGEIAKGTASSNDEINTTLLSLGGTSAQAAKDAQLYDAAISNWNPTAKTSTKSIIELQPALQGQIDKTLEVNDALNKNGTAQAANATATQKVIDAVKNHTTGLKDEEDQAQSITKAIAEQNSAYQGEEQSLLLLAREHGIYSDQLAEAAVSQEDNTTAMKEAIAASIDYTRGLTDVATNQKLVADGHLQGALALEGLVNNTIKQVAADEQYSTGLKGIIDTAGGLPPILENTTKNQELWLKTLLGSKDALAQLNQEIQNNAVKAFGNLNQVFSDMINNWGGGKDAQKELDKKLKEFLPKDIRHQVELDLDVKVNEQKLAEGLDLVEASLFTAIQNKATGEFEFKVKPNITLDQSSGTKIFENFKSFITDNLTSKGGDISSEVAKQMNAILDKGITDIQKPNANINEIVAQVFTDLNKLEPGLSGELSVLTENALKAAGVPQSVIDEQKANLAKAGTDTATGYTTALDTALKAAGVKPEQIAQIKASFDPATANAATSGTETATAFSTNLQTQMATSLASLDFTQTVFSTMIKAADITAQGIVDIFAQSFGTFETDTIATEGNMINELVGLYGVFIEQVAAGLATTEGSFTAYEGVVLKTEESLITALVGLYVETLYTGIGQFLISAAGSFTDYENTVVASEGTLIESVVGLYAVLLEQVAVALASVTESFTAYEGIVVGTEEALITALVGLYVETFYTAIGQFLISAAGSFTDYEAAVTESETTLIDSLAGIYGVLLEQVTTGLAATEAAFTEYESVVLQTEEDMITGLVGLYVETLYTAIGDFLISAADSWKDYEDTVVKSEEDLIQALVDLYIKTLYGDGIGAMLVEAAKSFKDYEAAVLKTEKANVAAIIKEYETLTDSIQQVLDDVSKEFEDGAEEWLTTVEDVVESIIEEFETIPDQVADVVDDINAEIDKITKEVTVKVKYDTSGKPAGAHAFGADFVTERGQPQLIMVGEGATRERVKISREGEPGFIGGEGTSGGGGSMVINDTINIYTSEGTYLGSARTRRVFKNLESH